MRSHPLLQPCSAVLSLIAWLLPGGCGESKPRIEYVEPRVTAIDWRGVNLAFDVGVKNPLPVPLRAAGGRYAVDIAGQQFVRSDAVPPLDVASRGRGEVVLPARFEYARILGLVRDWEDAAEVPYRLSGAIAFELAGQPMELPFAHDGEIPMLKMPEIEITGIKTGDIGFEGVSVTITAEIENPNAFPLGIGDVGFAVTLGGVTLAEMSTRTPREIKRGGKGSLEFTARASALDAVSSILNARDLSQVRVHMRGALDTPFGSVSVVRSEAGDGADPGNTWPQ